VAHDDRLHATSARPPGSIVAIPLKRRVRQPIVWFQLQVEDQGMAETRGTLGVTDCCPTCGETARLLHAGRSCSWVVMAGQFPDWFDGRFWERVECAGCGRLLEERSAPLDPPEKTRLRVVSP